VCRYRPTFPSGGENGPVTAFFPPVGGYPFFTVTIRPGDHYTNPGDLDLVVGIRELRKLPGVMETNEFDSPGMNSTDTVDMEIVLSEEVVLELADGAETTLRTSDVNIQNGTRHRRHNRASEPVVVATVGGTRHH
jgi:hypothetical protein